MDGAAEGARTSLYYFDHNATTPLSPKAREAWLETQDELWANPSSPTRSAARARNLLETLRARVGDAFEIAPERVIFTSGATEGNNAVIASAAVRSGAEETRIVISALEHPSVREPAHRWFGERVSLLPVSASGLVCMEALDAVLREGSRRINLVSVVAASNETGVLQPWSEVAERCRQADVPFHCDAVQWIGKEPLAGLGAVPFVTASGHKFGGPKGVGFLLLGKAETRLLGQVGGGQENGFRAGTEDIAGIAAMVAALEERLANKGAEAGGRDFFVSEMKRRGARILGETEARLANTVAMIMPRFDRMRWVARLDRLGFAIGSGSACASGKEGPSVALSGMGVSPEEAARALRVSGGPDAGLPEWRALADAFNKTEAALLEDEGDDRLTTVIEL